MNFTVNTEMTVQALPMFLLSIVAYERFPGRRYSATSPRCCNIFMREGVIGPVIFQSYES